MEAWDETRHASTFPAKNIKEDHNKGCWVKRVKKKTAINHKESYGEN